MIGTAHYMSPSSWLASGSSTARPMSTRWARCFMSCSAARRRTAGAGRDPRAAGQRAASAAPAAGPQAGRTRSSAYRGRAAGAKMLRSQPEGDRRWPRWPSSFARCSIARRPASPQRPAPLPRRGRGLPASRYAAASDGWRRSFAVCRHLGQCAAVRRSGGQSLRPFATAGRSVPVADLPAAAADLAAAGHVANGCGRAATLAVSGGAGG